MSPTKTPATRLARLSSVLDGARSMLIIVQNTPDPDAIAAAAALRELANERHEIACSIGYAGGVWRAENLALIRYLGVNTRVLNDLDLDRFDRLSMVDAQPGAGNVSFDASVKLDVVIDHHPIRRETRSARFTDIRSTVERGNPEIQIVFDQERAAKLGLAVRDIANRVVANVRGEVATRYTWRDKKIDVLVRSVDTRHSSVEEIREAVSYGAIKFNIDTDLRMASTGAVRRHLMENPKNFDPRKFLKESTKGMMEIFKARYEAFGCAGQADKINAISLEKMFMDYAAGKLDPVIK